MRKKQSKHRSERPSYRNYGRSALVAAYEACTKKNVSLKSAACTFGVPLSTLSYRVRGRIPVTTPASNSFFPSPREVVKDEPCENITMESKSESEFLCPSPPASFVEDSNDDVDDEDRVQQDNENQDLMEDCGNEASENKQQSSDLGYHSGQCSSRKYDYNALVAAYYECVEDNVPIRTAARNHGVPQSTLRNRLNGRVRFSYRKYDYSTLETAYAECVEHNLPVKTAARKYGVPYSTLRMRLTGRIRPSSRKYDQSSLVAAYKECVGHNVPVKTAARKYGVPGSTLGDRVKGRIPIDLPTFPTKSSSSSEHKEEESNVILSEESKSESEFLYPSPPASFVVDSIDGVDDEDRVQQDNENQDLMEDCGNEASENKQQSSHFRISRPSYRNYEYSALVAAYQDCVKHNVPIKTAAQKYGVPRSTLRDRLRGRIPIDLPTFPSTCPPSRRRKTDQSCIIGQTESKIGRDGVLVPPSTSCAVDDNDDVTGDDRAKEEDENQDHTESYNNEVNSNKRHSPKKYQYVERSLYKDYDYSALVAAYHECVEKKVSIMAAARKFGVPRSTLGDRVNGRIPIDLPISPSFYTPSRKRRRTRSSVVMPMSSPPDDDDDNDKVKEEKDEQVDMEGRSDVQDENEQHSSEMKSEMMESSLDEVDEYEPEDDCALGLCITNIYSQAETAEENQDKETSSQQKCLGPRKRYKQYTKSTLKSAALFAKQGNMSISRVANMFGVPPSTLKEKVKGKKKFMADKGKKQQKQKETFFINMREEGKLIKYFNLMAKFGYHFDQEAICSLAAKLNSNPFRCMTFNPEAMEFWYKEFLKRWPTLNVTPGRQFTTEKVTTYFAELSKILIKHSLFDFPELIYKIDEIGIFVDDDPKCHPAHLVAKRISNPYTSKQSPMFTMIGCGNALGTALPPYFLFYNEEFSLQSVGDTPPGTQAVIHSEEEGSSILKQYITRHFDRYVQMGKSSKGVILLYSGHSTFLSVDDIEWARQNNIYLHVLPPHQCKDSLEPYDVGLFGQLQTFVSKASSNHMEGAENETIDLQDATSIVGQAYYDCLSRKNVVSGFKSAGIYPFIPREFISSLDLEMQEELHSFNMPSQDCKNVCILPVSPVMPGVQTSETLLSSQGTHSNVNQESAVPARPKTKAFSTVHVDKIGIFPRSPNGQVSRTGQSIDEYHTCNAKIKIEKDDSDDGFLNMLEDIKVEEEGSINQGKELMPMKRAKLKRMFSKDDDDDDEEEEEEVDEHSDIKFETYMEDGVRIIVRRDGNGEDNVEGIDESIEEAGPYIIKIEKVADT